MSEITPESDVNEVGRELVDDVNRGDFDAAEQLADAAFEAGLNPPTDPEVRRQTDDALDAVVDHEIEAEIEDELADEDVV